MEAIIFIGIQASGKTTFYQERFSGTHVRINLDTLKTRSREEALLISCITARQPFVVDNTNVLARERARYIALAKPAGYRVIGYFFQTRLEEALSRNEQRAGKARIPVKGVRAKYFTLQRPQYQEGFDAIFTVVIDAENQFSVKSWQVTQG